MNLKSTKGWQAMALTDRLDLCKKIEAHRKRPLVVYVTSKRAGVDAEMATDALPYLIEQLDLLPKGSVSLDFLIVSFGGDPMVAWRLVSLIRERVDWLSVVLPQSAWSAATLVALGANEIVMHPNSHLGPVDMQISTVSERGRRHFSTEDVSAFVEFVQEKLNISEQHLVATLFEQVCKEVGSIGVGFTVRSSKLAVALGERLLRMHLTGDTDGAKRSELVEKLGRQFHSHAYPVSRTEAFEMGLPVKVENDELLDGLLWELWLDLEREMKEREPFSPIIELLNSEEKDRLLAPAPQLSLPNNASGPNYFQSDLDAIGKATVSISPVEYQRTEAIIESARLSHYGVTKGMILASRQPDLSINYNCLVSFRGWERKFPLQEGKS